MTFPDFPIHPLVDFCETNRDAHKVNSDTLRAAGFIPLLLRSFMTSDMHRWCEMELDYYNWTMQIVWFNDVEDRSRFVNRFIYPGWPLWQNDHTHGIQLSSADNVSLNEVVAQMQYLGAGFTTQGMHLFRAEGLAEPFEWDKVQGEYPTKDHMWMGATEHQAMIAKMCGLETFVTPTLSQIGVDIKGVTPEQGKATQARRLLGKYGVTLKERR